ncbi:DNA-binding transcriptional MerR regulator [Kibdelosporangium banguiense]|uniref:DNA-binding transcriptional MerR regulator n=1 Tax=Kibdelosporangium banguiense TaxID=1365924 RepID=A0ABS4TL89_9PSEU|nr:MerR family transcriptional regulator [Kibdelosporangium banguiense]MBP2325189.1 DNA-binding transcriptional MerR regulator [Kibdelosporangium banguiense]
MRPIDLAREAGISTQAVRNYADAGVLPAAPRTPSGYRTFDTRHLQALLTYRALARGYGGETAQAIMQAVNARDVPKALALIDASHAALHEQRQSLQAVGKALETIAGQPSATPPHSDMRIGEVAAFLGVRTSALRVWEAAGLLSPQRTPGTKYRTYGPADIRHARMIQMLRNGHYPLPMIKPILQELRGSGSTDALRAAIAQRQTALTMRATAMLAGASHLNGYIT